MSTEHTPAAPLARLTFASWLGGILVAAAFGLALTVAADLFWIAAHPTHSLALLTHSPWMSAFTAIFGDGGMLLGGRLAFGRRLTLMQFGLGRLRLSDLWLALGFVLANLAFAGLWLLVGGHELPLQVQMAQTWGLTWWAIPALALTAGFCEEIVFRGYFLLGLIQLTPRLTWLWLLLSTLVFGLSHSGWSIPSPLEFAPFAFFGLVAGVVVLRTRRLYPVIFGHVAWDLVSMLVLAHH